MTRREKRFLAFSVVMGGVLFVPQSAYAMHIMEGYLPPAYCAAWGALCLPFLAAGVVRLRRTVRDRPASSRTPAPSEDTAVYCLLRMMEASGRPPCPIRN